MSRIGNNPNKFVYDIKLPGVVSCVITHLPETSGYHAERFDVVKACLMSMRDRAGLKCSVMVWDNGSCDLLRNWLYKEYRPDMLVMSPNIGKNNAKTEIIRMQHPNTIIGIADDDMYFYPSWLKESVTILQHFPDVGVVSAYPVRTQFRWGCDHTIEWARKNGELNSGRIIDKKWDRDFCVSIGRDYEEHVRTSNNDLDYAVTYQGMSAFCTAHHCQFIGYAGKLSRFPDFTNSLLSPERNYDNAINAAGLLRLTTMDRLARHIGNIMDDDIREDAINSGYIFTEN